MFDVKKKHRVARNHDNSYTLVPRSVCGADHQSKTRFSSARSSAGSEDPALWRAIAGDHQRAGSWRSTSRSLPSSSAIVIATMHTVTMAVVHDEQRSARVGQRRGNDVRYAQTLALSRSMIRSPFDVRLPASCAAERLAATSDSPGRNGVLS
jgi:hypothetical protein